MASAAKDFDNSIHSVAMSAVLNLGNLVGLLCLFGFLLGHPSLLQLLAPRFDAADVAAAAGHSTSRRRRLWLPWGWALEAWRHHKVRLADDLDALAMLRFCVLGLKFSTIGSLMAVFLVPAYYAGRGRAPGFNAFNISNLRGDGGSFWLVVVAAYVLVGAFLHFAVKEWHLFLVLRREHFERLARGKRGPGAAQALRSVIVEFVPPDARQQDGSGVRRFFEDLFPLRGVHSCVLQPDTSQFHRDSRALDQPSTRQRLLQLRRAVVSREPAVREASGGRAACAACGYAPDAGSTWDLRLDSMLAETPGGERKEAGAAATPAAAKFHYGSQQPPTEDWELWENVLHPAGDLALGVADRTRQAAAIVQDLAIGRAHGSETAFVTLCSVADRVVAEQLVISHGEAWRVRAAPEARDVVWENAAVPLAQTRNRSIVAHAGLLCGLVFWSVPVSSIQAWTSLDETELGWTRSAVGMLVYTFLQGYLPVLALMALQAALPIAFMIIATRYERYKVRSEIQQILMRRNFYYQLATVYVTVVAATLSQTLHGQLREVFRRPSALLEILREEVPAVACYFNNYVMARIGIGLPMMLLCPLLARVSPCAWLKRRLTGGAAAGAEGAAKVPQQQRAADLETAAAEAAAATSTATAAAAEPAAWTTSRASIGRRCSRSPRGRPWAYLPVPCTAESAGAGGQATPGARASNNEAGALRSVGRGAKMCELAKAEDKLQDAVARRRVRPPKVAKWTRAQACCLRRRRTSRRRKLSLLWVYRRVHDRPRGRARRRWTRIRGLLPDALSRRLHPQGLLVGADRR
eukprot:TRINITY_DN8939_c2_g1_i1.p1 TRINITY_DN8939_c2_g1~~TRINITY_DN8939_c2_g1_i1.p1  ORF type:complete len:806 (+),score=185.36 TRINITY_DN8939_c2_g1_i1:40-2457(+)